MGRLLLFLVALFVLLWIVRGAIGAARRRRPSEGRAPPPAVELVECAHCGLRLPRTEARSAGGRHYCSEEHWRLGPRR